MPRQPGKGTRFSVISLGAAKLWFSQLPSGK